MNLAYDFECKFVQNILNATDTQVKLNALNQKWLKGLQTKTNAVLKTYMIKNFSAGVVASYINKADASQLFMEKKVINLPETVVPTKGSPHKDWATDVILPTPVYIPHCMYQKSSILLELVLPYTKLASTKALVAEAQKLANELAVRKQEIKAAIQKARNMKQFCANYPEFVKHLPVTVEANNSLSLISNLRTMGFDNTVPKPAPVKAVKPVATKQK